MLEPCREFRKLVKRKIRKLLKFLVGQYIRNIVISSYRTSIKVIPK